MHPQVDFFLGGGGGGGRDGGGTGGGWGCRIRQLHTQQSNFMYTKNNVMRDWQRNTL